MNTDKIVSGIAGILFGFFGVELIKGNVTQLNIFIVGLSGMFMIVIASSVLINTLRAERNKRMKEVLKDLGMPSCICYGNGFSGRSVCGAKCPEHGEE